MLCAQASNQETLKLVLSKLQVHLSLGHLESRAGKLHMTLDIKLDIPSIPDAVWCWAEILASNMCSLLDILWQPVLNPLCTQTNAKF